MSVLSIVLQHLSTLNAAELNQVIIMAQKFREFKGKDGRGTDEQLFFEVLAEQIEIAAPVSVPPFFIIQKERPSDYKLFVEVFDWLEVWIASNFKNVQKINKRRIYGVVSELVVEWVSKGPIPLSLITVLRQFKAVPGLIDKAFPGYAGNNMLDMILDIKYSSWGDNE